MASSTERFANVQIQKLLEDKDSLIKYKKDQQKLLE
jgi:hypothetical protein